jgi:hypothetical protein
MPNKRNSFNILLGCGCFLLFASRYPGLIADGPLNPDESQMLAGVLTAQTRGLVPWKDFDMTTIGPITVWFLMGVAELGMPMTYQSLHVLAATIWTLTSLLTLVSARMAFGIRGARFALLTLLIISLLGWSRDYLHFSSEAVPTLLLTAAALLVVKTLTSDLSLFSGAGAAFGCGALCALAFLAKLQALPIAAFLCVAAVLPTIQDSWKRRALLTLAAFTGAVLPVAILAFWLEDQDALALGIHSYVLGGASYGSSQSFGLVWGIKLFRDLSRGWGLFPPIFLVVLLVFLFLLFKGWKPWLAGLRNLNLALFFGGWFATALFVVIFPSNRFNHHGIFLIAPVALLMTYLACELSQTGIVKISRNQWVPFATPNESGALMTVIVALLLFVSSPLLIYRYWFKNEVGKQPWDLYHAQVYRTIDALSGHGEPIAVWGWAPEIYVVSGRPSATRHIIGHFLIDDNIARGMHRNTFMDDLRKSQPKLIIDVMADGFFTWRWNSKLKLVRAESFPELAHFLSTHYRVLQSSVSNSGEAPIIYEFIEQI